jgi:hypothetical protein
MRRGCSAVLLSACACAAPESQLDTSCPPSGSTPGALLVEIGGRGLQGPPESARFVLGGQAVMVAWKNLLSGRELTLSCAYRPVGSEWKLVRARLDDGTHTLRLSTREQPPALIYRDARGRAVLGI